MTSAALSVDRARAIGAAGATLCAGATLLGRHSLLRPALIAAASILGTVWLGVEPDVVRSQPRPLLERLEAEAERIGGGDDDDADGAKDSDADGGEPLLTPHAATRVRFCESV